MIAMVVVLMNLQRVVQFVLIGKKIKRMTQEEIENLIRKIIKEELFKHCMM